MHSCSLVCPQFVISAKCQGNKDGELRYVCRLPQVTLQAADSRIKTHNFKHSMWSLAHFVTIAPESRTRRKPKRTKPCLCWLLVEIELTALHTAGISCPSLVSQDDGRWSSQSGFSASWENLFVIASVRTTDAKKTYCPEAYPNPEEPFSLSNFSSKPTLNLLLGEFLPWGIKIAGKKTKQRKFSFSDIWPPCSRLYG